MLRFSTHFTKMHLLLMMMMMMWAFAVVTAELCDPLRQYPRGSDCCVKCGEGKSMISGADCKNPQCQDCDKNEYQDSWTTEPKCERQPYCNPDRNQEDPVDVSTIKRTVCNCKPGHHCSSNECLTCVPNTKCKPGQWAKFKGNRTHDTVCLNCPHGTFSTESSSDGVCKNWTLCGSGYHLDRDGTATSDTVCVANPREHTAVIAVVVPLILILLAFGVVFLLFRDPARRKVKGCMESCAGGEVEQKADEPPAVNPDDGYISIDLLKEPIQQISQDDSRSSLMPEENEDEQSQESFKPIRLSEKGNFVVQENGKLYPLPRQESQTQTYTQL